MKYGDYFLLLCFLNFVLSILKMLFLYVNFRVSWSNAHTKSIILNLISLNDKIIYEELIPLWGDCYIHEHGMPINSFYKHN